MYPMRDAEGPIGSFEVGMAFDPVLDHIKKYQGYDAGVFVNNELYTKIATGMPKSDGERLVGGLLNVASTDWKAIRPLVNADRLSRITDISTTTQTVNGVEFGTVIVPMVDYKGMQIGAIVAGRNFEGYQTQLKAALIANIALAVLQAMLLAGAVLVVLNSMVYRPLAALREKINAFAGGKPSVAVPELLKKDDEIGALAKAVQKLEVAAAERDAADAKKTGSTHA
jgi:HAMP domain-containing protein